MTEYQRTLLILVAFGSLFKRAFFVSSLNALPAKNMLWTLLRSYFAASGVFDNQTATVGNAPTI